jgi:anti-anti-sigma regulatory factor
MARQIKLPEEFYIGNVSEIAQEILSALQSDEDVVLDLSEVNRIDSAALQALLSARKEADCLGVTLSFIATEPIKDRAAAMGVTVGQMHSRLSQ